MKILATAKLIKGRVKEHSRQLRSGAISTVKEHDRNRHWAPKLTVHNVGGRTMNEHEHDAVMTKRKPTAAEYLHGREHTIDGIHGHFMLVPGHKAKYPYEHMTKPRLHHEPSTIGRGSSSYRKIKKELGDHWSTDMTDSENLDSIAGEHGYHKHYGKG